jgi:cyanophycinase
MKRTLAILVPLIILFSLSIQAQNRNKGYLFIIGGGDRPPKMMKRFLQLGDMSSDEKIVIFPMASGDPHESGKSMVEEFRNLGIKDVEYHVLDRTKALDEENVKILENVKRIYFPGGDQSLLTKVLVKTPLHRKMLEIYENGGVIGGTSAGAAVMSELMITGDEKREVGDGEAFTKILADNIVVTPGFGFIKTAIIDQHFVARKRHNRLISLIAEHPDLLGIGIDESTAIIVNPDETFEVIGEQNVVVYDATGAKMKILPSQTIGGFGIIMHLLKPGDRFDLKTKKPMD